MDTYLRSPCWPDLDADTEADVSAVKCFLCSGVSSHTDKIRRKGKSNEFARGKIISRLQRRRRRIRSATPLYIPLSSSQQAGIHVRNGERKDEAESAAAMLVGIWIWTRHAFREWKGRADR